MILINLYNKKTVSAYENVLVKYDRPSECLTVYSEQGELIGYVNPYDHRFNFSDIEKLREGAQYTVIRQKSGHAFAQESDICPESLFTIGNSPSPAYGKREISYELTYADCMNNVERSYDKVQYNADKTTRCKASENAMTVEWVSETAAPAKKMSFLESVGYLNSALDEVRRHRGG